MENKKWEVVEHNWSDTSIIDSNTGDLICTVSIYDEADEENQEELEKVVSENFNLIRKAPEMEAFLKKIVSDYKNGNIEDVEDVINGAKQILGHED